MTLLDLKSYFENYAAKHVELKHIPGTDRSKWSFFAIHDDQNINDFAKTCRLDLFMILMSYHKQMIKPQSVNYNWDKSIAFMVLKKVPNKDQALIIDALSQTEVICNDFCTRLIADRHTLLDSMDIGSVDMQPIGPIGDNAYGQICMFTLVDWFDQRVDQSRWLNA